MTIKVGDKVTIQGFHNIEVTGIGTCEDEGCGKPTLEIIDPEGQPDTVHTEDATEETK